jgi:hypothetical protein
VVLYYDAKGERRYHTLGLASEMKKGEADEKRQEYMREINGGDRTMGPTRPPTIQEFIDQVYLPFYRGKWKESTASTTENRISHHIGKEIGGQRLEDLTLARLQQFLEQKAASGLSFSVVDHLRWDLTSLFELAVSEKVISVNPTPALYTPSSAKRVIGQAMSGEQVEQALDALEHREKVILQLAVFAGMRPGELLVRIPGDADQRSEVMAIAIPNSCGSRFRDDGDHCSDGKPISFRRSSEWRSASSESFS